MNRESQPRSIDISRARRAAPRAPQPPVRPAAFQHAAPAAEPEPSAPPQPAETQAQGLEATVPFDRVPKAAAADKPAREKKPRGKRRWPKVVALALCAVLLVAGGGYWYLTNRLRGDAGSITANKDLEAFVPPKLTENQMNLLILGLDWEDEETGQRDPDHPMTDMILYAQLDTEKNTLTMLQIPRDCFVGAEYDQYTNHTCKINGLYAWGEDQKNRVQNLADVLADQLKLKVDHYVTIDMDSFKALFDAFGGPEWALEINVPYDMYDYDEDGNVISYLPAGPRYLKADELEFFLRCRKTLTRGDYDRLNNQRIFYSALFQYLRTMSVSEMARLMPWALNYVQTDIDPMQCVALGLAMMKIPGENITIGRLPVYGTQEYYVSDKNYLVSQIPAQETADFLNEYFRPAEAPVSADQLNLSLLTEGRGGVVEPEMSHMNDDGTVAEGVPEEEAPVSGVSTGDGEPASSAPAEPAA